MQRDTQQLKGRLGQGGDIDTGSLKAFADGFEVQVTDHQGSDPGGVGQQVPQPRVLLEVDGSYDQEHLQAGYQPGLLEQLGDGVEGLRDPAAYVLTASS